MSIILVCAEVIIGLSRYYHTPTMHCVRKSMFCIINDIKIKTTNFNNQLCNSLGLFENIETTHSDCYHRKHQPLSRLLCITSNSCNGSRECDSMKLLIRSLMKSVFAIRVIYILLLLGILQCTTGQPTTMPSSTVRCTAGGFVNKTTCTLVPVGC